MTTEAKIIEHSTTAEGHQLVTFQLKYPRFIHSEVMTHRVFSRNASSSRAIPVAKMIAQVRDDPATPVHWGANQPGMQARQELTGAALESAKQEWALAAKQAANRAETMEQLGLHKQVANRILEPFQWMHVVLTTTELDNFFQLRDHKDADPNIEVLAKAMREALNGSVPSLLAPGEWHLPYVTGNEEAAYNVFGLPDQTLQKISAARCARVSFLTHDGLKPDMTKDLDLFVKLAGGVPLHASPLEHQGTPGETDTGNFSHWTQFRKLWERQV